MATAQPVTECQRLQAELHPRADADKLMAMPQKNLQIALLTRRHPNRRKAIFRQQREQQASVTAVVFLLAGFGSPDLRGMTDAELDDQLFEQSQEPVHGARGFQAHQHRLRQTGIKLAHLVALVLQFLFD